MRSVDQSHLPLESELDSPGESELGLRVIAEKAKSRRGQSGARQRGQIWSSGSTGPLNRGPGGPEDSSTTSGIEIEMSRKAGPQIGAAVPDTGAGTAVRAALWGPEGAKRMISRTPNAVLGKKPSKTGGGLGYGFSCKHGNTVAHSRPADTYFKAT